MSEKNSSTIKLDKNSELRRARRTKLFFVFLLFILLILGGIVGFLRKKEFQISEVTIAGTRSFDPNIISKTAHEYLNGHYAIIIPKTNTLLLSKSDLATFITDTLPSLEKATVTFKGKNHIEISVAEKKPLYIWCATSCYFVDDSGMIYEESPKFTQGVFVTFSGGTIDGDPIKNRFVSAQQWNSALETIDALNHLKIHILDIHFGEDNAIHIDSINNIAVGPIAKLITAPTESVQSIFDALSLLMNDKVFTGTLATKGQSLQYIDIRFPEKIYYKFDAPIAEVAPQPTANAKLLEKTQ